MPMNAGTVNAAGAGVGLAKEIYDIHFAKLPAGVGPAALGSMADLFSSIATAVVAHILANAQVTTTVSAAGLQTYTVPPAGPVPTTPPLAPVPLTGSIA